MQLIIPMSGQGTRYIKAGYNQPKPLIEVNGVAMIERLLSVFPKDWRAVFILAENHATTGLVELLKKLRPTCQIKFVPPHDQGPGHALHLARDLINLEEPTLVSYCDYGMLWDATAFESFVQSTNCDACLVSYRGFHPHYLSTVTYAYSRLENDLVKEVREKGSFTSNRENEFASCGAYYFKSGQTLISAIDFQREKKMVLNGELYTSLTVQALIDQNPSAQVKIYEIQRFFQWGTPEELQAFEYWERTFKSYQDSKSAKLETEQVLMPMAGLGSRMQTISKLLKPLIPVHDEPMFRAALSTLPHARKNIFVTLSELKTEKHFKELKGETWIFLEKTPSGQALSVEAGLLGLDLSIPVLVSACDHGIVMQNSTWQSLIRDSNADAAIMTIRGYPLADRFPEKFAYVDVADSEPLSKVKRVSVKKPLSSRPSQDPLLVGTFWFRTGQILKTAIEELKRADLRVNGELYLDSVFNQMIASGLDIRSLQLTGYINWGDPDSFKVAKYWSETFLKRTTLIELVLPCYNESKSIEKIVTRAAEAAQFAGLSSNEFRLLLVENGSKDDSEIVMRQLKQSKLGCWFEIVKVDENRGYGYGLLQGLRASSAPFVAWSHADQQCDPADVFTAYLKIKDNPELNLVKGTRFGRTRGERFVSMVFATISYILLGLKVGEINAQPKVFRRSFLDLVVEPPFDFAFDLYSLYQAQRNGYQFIEIPVLFPPRAHGLSNWAGSVLGRYKTILKMIGYMWQLARKEGRL